MATQQSNENTTSRLGHGPELRSLLKDEYLRIQGFIESFDGHIMVAKTWSVTFGFAAIAGAFVSHSSIVLLVAAVGAASFLMSEVALRAYQYAYYDRAGKIEEYFVKLARVSSAEEPKVPRALQIGRSWTSSFKEIGLRRILKMVFWPETLVPHMIPLAVALVIYALQWCGVICV